MPRWTAFPYDNAAYAYSAEALRRRWPRLHGGDAEPLPADDVVLAAWALFHAGEFERAVDAGLKAGGAGLTVANKAQALYASYLEPSAKRRQALLLEAAERAESQIAAEPANANAHYLVGYALGHYGVGLSTQEALARGIGAKVKSALEAAIRLQHAHADARVALGAFHAEVIDKVGSLLGHAQGASKEVGLKLFRDALDINPSSVSARVEYARSLVMLEGERRVAQAEQLYAEAAALEPLDAAERLDVEVAKAELEQ